jgi:dTDP-4-amino-4,6-dideoxygalactose transaminase
VLLLPSARAGIAWALESTGARVAATTALTCPVVHEAIVRAGTRLLPLDTAPGSFLVDEAELARAARDGAALVLCELYGHPYDLEALAERAPDAFRIIDLAMTVPTREVAARIGERDVGVVSFGIGKCCYAGWGGVAILRDPRLAEAMREQRHHRLGRGSVLLGLARALALVARTLAHEPWLYRLSRGLQEWRARRAGAARPDAAAESTAPGPEWRLPSTGVDRAVLRHLCARFETEAAHRLAQAQLYDVALADIEAVQPPVTQQARSHYTVRVAPGARDRVREQLWRAGVDAGTLFGLPPALDAADFPEAHAAARALLNLPLGYGVAARDVERIAASLRHAVAATR